MSKYKNLQLQVKEEIIEILKQEKKNQRKTMALIVEELIIEKYATLDYKLKKLNE